MDRETAAARGAELVEAIEAELGPHWLQLGGIAGADKEIVVWDDDTVALRVGAAALYLADEQLWVRFRDGGAILTGYFADDEIRVVAKTPDASRA